MGQGAAGIGSPDQRDQPFAVTKNDRATRQGSGNYKKDRSMSRKKLKKKPFTVGLVGIIVSVSASIVTVLSAFLLILTIKDRFIQSIEVAAKKLVSDENRMTKSEGQIEVNRTNIWDLQTKLNTLSNQQP